MAEASVTRAPEIVGNHVQVVGTMDRTDWHKGVESRGQRADVANRMYFFEDVWIFEVDPLGRCPAIPQPATRTDRPPDRVPDVSEDIPLETAGAPRPAQKH
jgi:hypothetical protein